MMRPGWITTAQQTVSTLFTLSGVWVSLVGSFSSTADELSHLTSKRSSTAAVLGYISLQRSMSHLLDSAAKADGASRHLTVKGVWVSWLDLQQTMSASHFSGRGSPLVDYSSTSRSGQLSHLSGSVGPLVDLEQQQVADGASHLN
ncbi:hypothetical protein AVEN_48417-1 [Araneus ventricosus]|uniref:Uncharacterized protein n=1 Tax=Araneus ventricosus TaxID=182803 RepID=A0A4Y2TGI0_ARAVE|nr:hypothetical protein AVEN_48417-1 [Araneus ventricosus]